MNPWILTPDALQEPWRLWTCHLVHHDLEHAAGNALALLIPFALAPRGFRQRVAVALLCVAPVVGLALLPFLDGGTYRGISALACAAWAFLGLHLAASRDGFPVGLGMLALLSLKLGVEGMTGAGVIVHDGRWQSLSASHLLGTLGGLAAGLLEGRLRRTRGALRSRWRRSLTCPR